MHVSFRLFAHTMILNKWTSGQVDELTSGQVDELLVRKIEKGIENLTSNFSTLKLVYQSAYSSSSTSLLLLRTPCAVG